MPAADRTEVSFVAFNDIHGRFGILSQMLAAAKRPADFVVFNGDMLSYLDDEVQVLALLKAGSEAFAGSKPLVYVRGNHETRGSYARLLRNYLALPGDRYYYSFDCGPVHVTVLDTGEDKVDSHWAYSGLADFDRYRSEQAEWLRHEIKSPAFLKAKYRVVLAHMPFPEASGTEEYHGMADANAKFGPLLRAAGVDLLISAHEHKWAIMKPVEGKHDYAIVRGGGPEQPTLIHVAADSKTLSVQVLLQDGTTAESYAMKAQP
ncbi:MAG TPA: metallophosphoesterase [Terriglobales bacterium]|nr:metallophosphoesterase [Terriglobales bacterium]